MKKTLAGLVIVVAALSLTGCAQPTPEEKYASCMKTMTDKSLGDEAMTHSQANSVCYIDAYGDN